MRFYLTTLSHVIKRGHAETLVLMRFYLTTLPHLTLELYIKTLENLWKTQYFKQVKFRLHNIDNCFTRFTADKVFSLSQN